MTDSGAETLTDEPKKPLLELDTSAVRPIIKVDGEDFELIHPYEFSIADRHRLARQANRFYALLFRKGKLTDAERVEMAVLLQDISSPLLAEVPEPVQVKLKDGHRLAVLNAYFPEVLRILRVAAGQLEQTMSTNHPTNDEEAIR